MILQGLSQQHVHPWEWACVPCWKQQVSHETGAPTSLPAGLCKEGNPLWLLRKGCALLLLTWPVRVCIQVSEWASNYNSCNLLRLAIKGCLEICSSLQNVNTLLLILILNIQLTDYNLITYVNIPLESWFWANNLIWTVFPLNKVYPFTICYPTGWRKRTISKLWGGLCPFQELQREGSGNCFRTVWKWGLHCKARVCQKERRTKFPHSTRS